MQLPSSLLTIILLAMSAASGTDARVIHHHRREIGAYLALRDPCTEPSAVNDPKCDFTRRALTLTDGALYDDL